VTGREQSELELQALQRVVASGRRALDLDVVLDRCLEQTIAVSRADAGLIYFADEPRGCYTVALRRGIDPDAAPDIVPMPPPQARVQDHALIDLRTVPTTPSDQARVVALARGFTHCLLFILRVDQRRVGFVSTLFRSEPVVAESTLRTIEAIAAFEAVAIESARVHRQVALRARLAQMLVDCSERLLDPEADAPALILETACKMVGGDRALLAKMEHRGDETWARIVHAVGRDTPLVGMTLAANAPYLRESLAQAEPMVVEHVESLDPSSVIGQTARQQGTKAFVLLTMRRSGRPVGQLLVGTGEPRTYAEEEIEALRLLSSLGAQALARAEREAAERAEHAGIAEILEHLPIVVAVIDRSGKLVHINAAGRAFAERMGRVPGSDWREAMTSVQIFDRDGRVVPPSESGTVRAFSGEATARELTLQTSRGERLHVLGVTVPLRGPDGSVHAVLTSFQDVTGLRDLADAKDRFLSIASHELRSPITSLRATTSLLQLDPHSLTDEARRELLLGRIQRQIDRLSTLVERLLDTTRLNAGEMPLELGDCDVVELCREATEHARMTDREHAFTLEASPSSIVGRWDAARLEQVLTNLLSNACRYSPAQTEIVVRARATDGHVVVDVVDQGLGIAPEQREKLFTPFYRGEAAARHKGGLGLGLYISREIVRRHGGTIRVSATPGRGATFTVELPLKA
jgi:signal transduction histidine kinase/GAF domain-containing protein